MNYFAKPLAAGFVIASIAAAPVLAAGTHPVTGEALADDQTFTYSLLDDSTSLDPQIIEDVSGSAFARDLFEGLMNQDGDGNLVPGVATGFTTNADKTVYTFNLRDNAKWSDGNPVTAHDFVYAWRRAADPETGSPYSWFMEIMAIAGVGDVLSGDEAPDTLGVRAVDDLTFEVTLTASLPYFASMTTHATTFPTPSWVIEEHGAEWTRPENMVGNGAYVLTEHILGETSTRERSTTYWNNEATIVDTVTALIIASDDTALTRYLAGELTIGRVPSGQYLRLKAEYPEQAKSNPRLCTYYYSLNMGENGPESLKDIRVRQALSYAVDRSIITENILQAGQIPAFTFTPGATAGFEVPEVEFGMMSQDERNAKAVELLADAGYGSDNPLELELLYNTSEGHKSIATAIVQMWKETLGIDVTLANMEWKTFLQTKGDGNYDIGRAGWCGDYNEASTFLDLVNSGSGYNDSKFSNAEVDALLESARTMDDASANYTRIEEIVATEMPLIPVYHYTGVGLYSPSLKGWPFGNVEGNWYSRDLYIVE
ncbi:MAG: peptide ABC transporter substrate-binding protein [Paracoccaceae bacterium]